MKAIATIHGRHGTIRREFDAPVTLSALLDAHHAAVDQPCGGQGKCGKCRVKVLGALSPVSAQEKKLLPAQQRADGVRLACLASALWDVEIWLERQGQERILTQFSLPALTGKPWSQGLGIAVDIGTTTVAAYLYDLQWRNTLAVTSCTNPQRPMGADVVSRLKASLEGQGPDLKEKITSALGALCQELLQQAGREAQDLTAAVITGNTAMLYLLTGREVSSIAFAPFVPNTTFGQFVPGAQVGLPPHVQAWLPECISAYVGADITCAALYSGLCRHREPVLLADVGTNGEMILSANGKMYTCSTAAGPAFEGAGISQGMTAQEGAISRVDFDGETFTYQVIGHGEAKGLCGSGLVDAVAALIRAAAIDETGRLQMTGHALERHMSRKNNEVSFIFPGSAVSLTQSDIRAVQLAKAAICAGILVLIEEAGIIPGQVDQVLIAGGFGSSIRPEAAEAIGLIPPGFASRTHAIGNAAGAGAAMMLLSDETRKAGARLAAACQTVELSTHPFFSDAYIDCMAFEQD